ncbi:MAG: hypothetical protein AMXMBFR57_00360 [Acidimicrobiia bacterium]
MVGGRRAAGLSESLQQSHLIAIGSITKTMTAAVVLQLAAEGRLGLDDPIAKHLPPRLYVSPDITIRQLLNHTSGVANYTGTSGLSQLIAASPGHVFTADELLNVIGPPRFLPGTATEYTNTAFLLAGQVAERVGGTTIAELYRSRLWLPTGLTATWLPGYGRAPGPVAMSLSSEGLIAPTDRMEVLSVGQSAFGVMATASDVARWGHALFTGSVVSGGMQSEMRTLEPAAGNIPGESGSGLGIRAYDYLGRSQLGHSGASAFGNSLLLHDIGARVTVVVLMNQASGADHFVLGPALLELAL